MHLGGGGGSALFLRELSLLQSMKCWTHGAGEGEGVWHKASVSDCLPLAAPIGLSPLGGGGGHLRWCAKSTASSKSRRPEAKQDQRHSRSTGRSGRQKAATRRNMRREDRVTVPGPVKKQQPDGMSHGGGGGGHLRRCARHCVGQCTSRHWHRPTSQSPPGTCVASAEGARDDLTKEGLCSGGGCVAASCLVLAADGRRFVGRGDSRWGLTGTVGGI